MVVCGCGIGDMLLKILDYIALVALSRVFAPRDVSLTVGAAPPFARPAPSRLPTALAQCNQYCTRADAPALISINFALID